ncbi:hypothetical protein, partial [Staphylococcus aureus]
QCPLQQVACTVIGPGTYACPLSTQYACEAPSSGGAPTCSPNACQDTGATPIVVEPPIADPGTPADGTVDANGNCTANIEIFSGRGMRCRPPGL